MAATRVVAETSMPALTLPTPDIFPFPYAEPYPIQMALMRHIYSSVEAQGVRATVVESPTGTVRVVSVMMTQS